MRKLFNGSKVLSFSSDKAKLCAKNVSKNFSLDGSGIVLLFFVSRTNLKLHNIYVTPKDIPDVHLKNYMPEISYMLAASSNLQYVSEEVSFSRLLEGLIGGPCI